MSDEKIHGIDALAALATVAKRPPGRPKGSRDTKKRKTRSDKKRPPRRPGRARSLTYEPRPLNAMQERFCYFYVSGQSHGPAVKLAAQGTSAEGREDDSYRRTGLRWIAKPQIRARISSILDDLSLPVKELAAKAKEKLWRCLSELEPGDSELTRAITLALRLSGELGAGASDASDDKGATKIAAIILAIRSGEVTSSPAQLSQHISRVLERSDRVALPEKTVEISATSRSPD